MEGEQNNEGSAPIFGPVEVDLHSSGDTGFLGWSSPNTVEHEASTTDGRNLLENENEVSRLNDKMDKNDEELRDLNHKIDQNSEELKRELKHNYEELRTEMQRNNEQLKRDMEQMRGELNNKIVETTEVMRVEINKDLNTLDEGLKKLEERVRLELSEQAEINKDRDRANLDLDQDGENGKASKDIENKSITGSSLQEIEDMGNRVEKSLNKRLDKTLGKLENKQTELENMMRNQSMVGMRISQPANTEIFLLEFDPIKNNVHPMEFLEACKKYIEKNGEGWDFQVLIILKYMKNEAGKWGRQHINNWKHFEQFYRSFKGKYWSIGEQNKFEKELMGNGTYRVGSDNLVTYVLEFYNKSQYLETRIDMGTFLAYISEHVPRTISSAIAAAQNVERSEDLENLLNRLNILNSDTNRSYDRSLDMRNERTLNRNVNQYMNLRPRDTPYRGTQVRGNI
ncbi:hypothetical protein J6590_050812 [Homalodisca vitripennis]|nr:hypothetical protein J6590_050812 [Homalodisca vitripennis]